MICKPAYAGRRARKWQGLPQKGIQYKNTFGCMATLICVAAAGLVVVIQWQLWVRGDQWLTKHLIKSIIRRV